MNLMGTNHDYFVSGNQKRKSENEQPVLLSDSVFEEINYVFLIFLNHLRAAFGRAKTFLCY